MIGIKSSRKSVVKVVVGTGVALAAIGGGCLSMQSQSTLDGASSNSATSNQPFVEAYVEYPGPQAKWAGPASFILHVTAKDAGLAQITMTPELRVVESREDSIQDGTTSQRAPAASPSEPGTSVFRNMTSDEARAQLAYMANALQGAQAPFKGCMSPVRIRMIRTNGAIFEKQGCRSELGWSRAVSESVSAFVEASTSGMQSKPSMEPTRVISSDLSAKPASDEAPAASAKH